MRMYLESVQHLRGRRVQGVVDNIKFVALLGTLVMSITTRAHVMTDPCGREVTERMQQELDTLMIWIGQGIDHLIGFVDQALDDPTLNDLKKTTLLIHIVHYFWHKWGAPLPEVTEKGKGKGKNALLLRAHEETPWERFIRQAVIAGPPATVTLGPEHFIHVVRRLRIRANLPSSHAEHISEVKFLIQLAQTVFMIMDVADARTDPGWAEQHAEVVRDLDTRPRVGTPEFGGITGEVAAIKQVVKDTLESTEEAGHKAQICAHYILYVWDKYNLEPLAEGGTATIQERNEECERLTLVINRMIRDAASDFVANLLTDPTVAAGSPPAGTAEADDNPGHEFFQKIRIIMMRRIQGEHVPRPVDDVMFVVLVGMLTFHTIAMPQYFAEAGRTELLQRMTDGAFEEGDNEETTILEKIGMFKQIVDDAEGDDQETDIDNRVTTIVFLVRWFWNKYTLPEPTTENDPMEADMIDDIIRDRVRFSMLERIASQINRQPGVPGTTVAAGFPPAGTADKGQGKDKGKGMGKGRMVHAPLQPVGQSFELEAWMISLISDITLILGTDGATLAEKITQIVYLKINMPVLEYAAAITVQNVETFETMTEGLNNTGTLTYMQNFVKKSMKGQMNERAKLIMVSIGVNWIIDKFNLPTTGTIDELMTVVGDIIDG